MNSSFVSCRTRLWKHVKKAAQGLGFAIAFCLACLPLSSQTSQGTIQGGVFDQSGGAVAGATVSVIDVARGVTRALTADGAGQYVAVDLTPGTYTVRAEAKGFRNVEHSGVLLEVGQTVRVDLVVQPGEQTQTITVTGEIPAVDTTDATLGGTVTQPVDHGTAAERPQLRALARPAPGDREHAGRRYGQLRTPTAGAFRTIPFEWKESFRSSTPPAQRS